MFLEKDELDLVETISSIASLMHDIGKSIAQFQERLSASRNTVRYGKNHIRHEWVSLRIFEAFVEYSRNENISWLELFKSNIWNYNDISALVKTDGLGTKRYKSPFVELMNEYHHPMTWVIGWLILTHHRMITPSSDENFTSIDNRLKKALKDDSRILKLITVSHNEDNFTNLKDEVLDIKEAYWNINPEVFNNRQWRLALSQESIKLENLGDVLKTDDYRLYHIARMMLMVSDHHYSSLSGNDALRYKVDDINYSLYANITDSKFNQPLVEHLLGVSEGSIQNTRDINDLIDNLPYITRKVPNLCNDTLNKDFKWQNEVYHRIRDFSNNVPAFIVNMASTGTGKTIANLRALNAFGSLRVNVCLGLRTLTNQTFKSFKNDLGLSEDNEVSVLIGSTINEYMDSMNRSRAAWNSGSESSEDMSIADESLSTDFNNPNGNVINNSIYKKLSKNNNIEKILLSPVLVSTVDYMVRAIDTAKGGKHIIPLLRLFSSDLVLDEIDDYSTMDKIALSRLVYMYGLFRRKVIVSSATVDSDFTKGLYQSWLNGYQQSGGDEHALILCDEFETLLLIDQTNDDGIDSFFNTRLSRIKSKQNKPRVLVDVVKSIYQDGIASSRECRIDAFASRIINSAKTLHEHNHGIYNRQDGTNVKYSVGLVRMAHVTDIIDISNFILKSFDIGSNYEINVCVYHSRFPSSVRSIIENKLDRILNRKGSVSNDNFVSHNETQKVLETTSKENIIFIVIGSPVTEVGRDHDYDWAVIEPSSIRSIIQICGRVKRHRQYYQAKKSNVHVLDQNIASYKHSLGMSDCPFSYPGPQDKRPSLKLLDNPFNKISKMGIEQIIRYGDAYPFLTNKCDLQYGSKSSLLSLERKQSYDNFIKSNVFTTTRAYHYYSIDRLSLTAIHNKRYPFRYTEIKEDIYKFSKSTNRHKLKVEHVVYNRQTKSFDHNDINHMVVFENNNYIDPHKKVWINPDMFNIINSTPDGTYLQFKEVNDSRKLEVHRYMGFRLKSSES